MGLSSYRLNPSIAVSDISEAAKFYEGKLGLEPGPEQSDESRVYPCGGGTALHVYVSPTPNASGTGTVATWYVPDLNRAVDELGSAGIAFERYDDPALKADDSGIHELDGGRVAWFRDPDGNTFAIEEGTASSQSDFQGAARASSPAEPPRAWVDPPTAGRALSMSAPKVLLRSEQSDGVVAAIEIASPAGFKGPPLHRHNFDEAFYVLEGELTFQLRDEVFRRRAGELAFAPRNVAHTYANKSDKRARALIVCTPAGFERYFARMAAEREGVQPPPWALSEIPEVVRMGPRIGEAER